MNISEINLDYTKDLVKEHYNAAGDFLPSTYAMFWCMMATSVNRIFTREDMKEFLFRLAITLHSLELVEKWLLKDKLMNFTVKNADYIFKTDDILIEWLQV